MHFKVNLDDIDKSVMTVCIGSARGYGQTPSGVPYNGLLDVSVVSHPEISQMVEALWMLFRGRFLNHKAVKSYRTKEENRYTSGMGEFHYTGLNGSEPTTMRTILF